MQSLNKILVPSITQKVWKTPYYFIQILLFQLDWNTCNNKTGDSIVRELCLIFIQGNLKDLETDNGTCFTNEKVSKNLEAMEIEYIYTSPYHPQSNGSVEAFNKTIQNFFKWSIW